MSLVSASTFHSNYTNFNNGIYQDTFLNITFIQLNFTKISGNYTSEIFDATSSVSWSNMTWCGIGNYESPNNKGISCDGKLNMTGNVILTHMDESSGNILDYSGFSNNGTYNGAGYLSSGIINKGISFDGINDYVTFGDENRYSFGNGTKDFPFSISLWFKKNSSGANEALLSRWDASIPRAEYALLFNTGNQIRFLLRDDSTNGTIERITVQSMSANQWYHVAAVYNGSSTTSGLNIYINGELVSMTSSTSGVYVSMENTLANLLYGDFITGSGGHFYFNGTMDEAMILNRTLSQNEISELYKRGITKLNLSARSCDDALCSGESFIDQSDVPPSLLSVPDNRYFQYLFNFLTGNFSFTPELYNVTIFSGAGTPIPSITDVNYSSVTHNSAVITWNTDVVSNSTVRYGETLSLVNSSGQNDAVISHSVSLAGLNYSTTYYFNVTSCNFAGCNSSGIYYLTTTAVPLSSPNNVTEISITSGVIYKQDTDILLKATCFSTGYTYCNNGVNCSLQLTKPDSTILLNDVLMTYTQTYFYYNLDQTSDLGKYYGRVVCNNEINAYKLFDFEITPTGKVFSKEIVYVYLFFLLICLIITALSVKLTINNSMQKDEMTSSQRYQQKKMNEVKFYLEVLKKKMWIVGLFGIYLSILLFLSLLSQLTFSLGITELTDMLNIAVQILGWGLIPFIIFWIVYIIIYLYKSTESILKYQFGGFRSTR